MSKVADGLHIVDQLHDIRDSLWEYGEIEVDNEPNQTTYFTLVARWPRYKAGRSRNGYWVSHNDGGGSGDQEVPEPIVLPPVEIPKKKKEMV